MSERQIIEPKVLKGFRDFLPDAEATRKRIIRLLEDVMEQYGFVPIDTPVLEYTEVLLGKGGGETDKQVYRFKDAGDRDVSMRFDLTVPFARYMAAHRAELYLPFKRFHFAKVWRGENAQRGRYREFMQCDFDSVGVDAAGSDFEILLVMKRAFEAMGVPGVRFHLNHRGVFNRFLEARGIREHSVEILRCVDKLKKIGVDETRKLLGQLVSAENADAVLAYIQPAGGGEPSAANSLATLDQIEAFSGGTSPDSERLRTLFALAKDLGIDRQFVLDPSITRGLDYYTGIVYETFLVDLPSLGSVCSGGRYNDLAGLYTKEALPGVGSSIGLDRLLAGLEELGVLGQAPRGADLAVFCQDEALLGVYQALAEKARAAGLRAEVYPQAKKLNVQFGWAEKKRIPFGLIVGSAEHEAGTVNLKNLITRESQEGISAEKAFELVKTQLSKAD